MKISTSHSNTMYWVYQAVKTTRLLASFFLKDLLSLSESTQVPWRDLSSDPAPNS